MSDNNIKLRNNIVQLKCYIYMKTCNWSFTKYSIEALFIEHSIVINIREVSFPIVKPKAPFWKSTLGNMAPVFSKYDIKYSTKHFYSFPWWISFGVSGKCGKIREEFKVEGALFLASK